MSKEDARFRIDKWLWAARFYKTRSLACQAVEGGKVRWNDARVKPSREVKVGDELAIRNGEMEWRITVMALSVRRGSATDAAELFEESAESRERRELMLAMRQAGPRRTEEGRPTKRDRRLIERLRREG